MGVAHRYSLSEAYENLGGWIDAAGAEGARTRAAAGRAQDLRRAERARRDLGGVRRGAGADPKGIEVGRTIALCRLSRLTEGKPR